MAKATLTTPKGTARYPWLNTSDTNFGDPKYKVDLIVDSGERKGNILTISATSIVTYMIRENFSSKNQDPLHKVYLLVLWSEPLANP